MRSPPFGYVCLLLIRSPSCPVHQRSPLARCSLREPYTPRYAHGARHGYDGRCVLDEDDARHAQGAHHARGGAAVAQAGFSTSTR